MKNAKILVLHPKLRFFFILLCFMFILSFSVSCSNAEHDGLLFLQEELFLAKTKKTDVTAYLFTESQQEAIRKKAFSETGASLFLGIQKLDSIGAAAETFSFAKIGFLYKTDIDSKNNLKMPLSTENCVLAENVSFVDNNIRLSLCIDFTKELPVGFYVQDSSKSVIVNMVDIISAVVGFDESQKIPFYALSQNGGELRQFQESFDFLSAKYYFSELQKAQNLYSPQIKIKFRQLSNQGTPENQVRVNFSYGNEKFTIRRTFSQKEFLLPLATFKLDYGILTFTENASQVSSVLLSASEKKLSQTFESDSLFPISTDLGLIYEWPLKSWRSNDYELFRWQQFPEVLVFDFANYETQNQFLTRLAYFVEKNGYKGTLVSDDFIKNRHGYNAHDYKAKDLAAFFTKAAMLNFNLNQKELLLREILIKNGIIVKNSTGTFDEGQGAIISISRESPMWLRHQLMAHESWHGIYFTKREFRDEVEKLYSEFDETALEFLKVYWETYPSLGYDRNDEYLMQNEFMAYLMQQGLDSVGNYFASKADWNTLNKNRPDLTAYIRRTNAKDFVQAAIELDAWAFAHYGLGAGRSTLIAPL
mgnify:FL=1